VAGGTGRAALEDHGYRGWVSLEDLAARREDAPTAVVSMLD